MLRIRLARRGAIHRPFYRFVVSDSRKRPCARAVDTVGDYDPTRKPARFEIDVPRAEEWIRKGAVPSGRVMAFLERAKKSAQTA